jgi:hypothetical protein
MLLQDSNTVVIARTRLLCAVLPAAAGVAEHNSAGDTIEQVRTIAERMGWRQPDKAEEEVVVAMQDKNGLWAWLALF